MKINIDKSFLNSVILIDGSYHLYRFYFSTSHVFYNFRPNGVIYCFVNLINSIIRTFLPKKIVFVFDSKYKNGFRKKAFERYKSNRTKMPKNLSLQIFPLNQLITSLGIPSISIPNVEADDIIGTITSIYKKKYKILISTMDKDMYQLISKNVRLINNNHQIIGVKEILIQLKIFPHRICDYLTLVGDSTDNIPGIPKIGKKTAISILKKFKNLKYLYKNLDDINKLDIKNKKIIINNLKKYKKEVFFIQKILKIKKNIDLSHIKNFDFCKINKKNLLSIIKKYNLKNLEKIFKNRNNFSLFY